MPNTELIRQFWQHVSTCITPEGVYPQPAFKLDTSGRLTALSIAVSDPTHIMDMMSVAAARPDTAEAVFCLDRFAKPGQGVETDDLLTVHHYTPLTGWSLGIIEYRYQPRLVKPIDWSNAFWLRMCRSDMERLAAETARRRAKIRRMQH